MAIAYPLNLRTILQAGKQRTQPATFKTHEPRRGFAYFQKTGTHAPVFWTVTFTFTESEAQTFWVWFKSPLYLDSGAKEFTLPIKTEFGLVTHTCRFLPDTLLPVTESGGTFTYTATIMARALVEPAVTINIARFYVEPQYRQYMHEPWPRILDIGLQETLHG